MAEDFDRAAVPGGDPTRPAPGLAGAAEDPATVAVTDTGASASAHVPRSTNAGRLWISLALATALLVLLIVFIAENSRSVTVSFLGAHGHISLALALLIAAVVGAAVTLLAGTARILQLRREVRRNKRANTGGGHRPEPN